MTNFNIKVVSDAICPWCYVGKKRLERAIELYKRDVPGGANDTFNISWHPFYLDPTLPKGGVDVNVHLAEKYGPQRAAMINSHLTAVGEAEGIKFSQQRKVGNTRDAHRLVQLAKTKSADAQDRLVSTLFRSHFEEGADITSQGVLVAVAEKAGLDKNEAQDWLDQGKGGEEVDKEVGEAYQKGIHGVPNFTINDRYELNGAQDPQKFLEVFAQAKKTSPDVSVESSKGPSC
ncbi:hypothetical protein VTH82DRAFT_6472 [Thermothelomyces myriococcoides]